MPRPLVVAIVAVVALLAGTWLVTTAWQRAHPPAAAEVAAFQIESDTNIDVTLHVDRTNPSVAVVCRLVAQASDYQVVGEQEVAVPPGETRTIDLNVTLITLRRAVSAEVRGCSVV
jgi:hypothetical protein